MAYPVVAKWRDILPQISFSMPAFEILLLEDHPDAAFTIRRSLNQIGRVFWEQGVSSGVELSKSTNFDIAIIDLNVDDRLSLKAFEDFHEAMPDVPVMILTGNDALLLAESAMEEGAVGILNSGRISQCDYLIKKVTAAVIRAKFLKKAREFKPRTVKRLKS